MYLSNRYCVCVYCYANSNSIYQFGMYCAGDWVINHMWCSLFCFVYRCVFWLNCAPPPPQNQGGVQRFWTTVWYPMIPYFSRGTKDSWIHVAMPWIPWLQNYIMVYRRLPNRLSSKTLNTFLGLGGGGNHNLRPSCRRHLARTFHTPAKCPQTWRTCTFPSLQSQ